MPDTTATTGPSAVVERTVDATPAEVWSLWTETEQFSQWYGPVGATIPVARLDLRVGGERVVSMTVQTPGGERSMWFRGVHVEVDAPRLLAYTETMTDEDGSPQSPETTVRVEFEEAPGDRTVVRVTHIGIPADSPGSAGWTMALDKLAALVA